MYDYLVVGSGLYGAHIFHTNNTEVWNYITQFGIIEHRWFEFGRDEDGNDLPKTIISREYSSEWKLGDEPYYPVDDEKNDRLYAAYRELADKEEKVIFGGRLGEYRYYDRAY